MALTPFFFTSCDDEEVDDDIINNLREADLFTSSNTSGEIMTFDFSDKDNITSFKNTVPYADADGIYYDDSGDVFFQINRTDNRVEAFEEFKKAGEGASITPTFSSPAGEFTNGRGLAFSRNRVIVAQDGNDDNGNENKIVVYDYDDDDGFTLRSTHTVDFNLWGIFAEDDDVYAVIDNSSEIAYFDEFYDLEEGAVTPTKVVSIEGLVRTHGIHFSEVQGERVILTDVGDADSDSDGAIIVIEDFDDKVNDAAQNGVIALSDQVRFAGSNTFLGNPVDVEYDHITDRIYVAERKTDGGLLLVFDVDDNENGGNVTPMYNANVAGISSVALDLGL